MVGVKPNLIDRAVAFFNPRAGLDRVAARTQLMATTAMFGDSGGYRGARGDRRQRRGWFSRAGSANADIVPGSAQLRADQRDAVMNQPVATAAINRTLTFTIGTGLMAIPELDAERLQLTPEQKEAWERRLATDYDAYMQSMDPDAERTATGYDQQDIVLRGVLTSGNMVALRVMPDNQPGRVIETAWKLLEADHLKNPSFVMDGHAAPNGNDITGGVETDAFGAPVAYHLLPRHPGDLNGRAWRAVEPNRIEAWDPVNRLPRVVHCFVKERPGQVTGVGILAPVLETLKQLSDLTDSELFAAVMSAMIAIVYKSPGATPMPEPDFGDEGGAETGAGLDMPSRPQSNYRLEQGTVLEIDSDCDVDVKSPGRPNSAYDPFFQSIVRMIGAAIEVPFEVLMAAFNSSYTASRASLEVFYQMVRKRVFWMASHWCKPSYQAWLAEKVARGDYEMPGFFSDPLLREAWCAVGFRGDGKISLDPNREANALATHQDRGWQTGEQITAGLTGGSYADNIRKRGAEHRAWQKEGLPIPGQNGAPAKPEPKAEPAEKEEEEA